jgi:hypothetical protein
VEWSLFLNSPNGGDDSSGLRWVSSKEQVSGILKSIHVCNTLRIGKEENGIKEEVEMKQKDA